MAEHHYPTDLTNATFAVLGLLFTLAAAGRRRIRPTRDVLDVIFYVPRTVRAWCLLPREFPPWLTVYYYFRIPRNPLRGLPSPWLSLRESSIGAAPRHGEFGFYPPAGP